MYVLPLILVTEHVGPWARARHLGPRPNPGAGGLRWCDEVIAYAARYQELAGHDDPWEILLLDRLASLARIPRNDRGLGTDGAALATNPHRLAQAVQSVRTLRAVAAEGAPDPDLARRVVIEVFGDDLNGGPLGAGATLLEALRSPSDPAEPRARLDELLALLEALQEIAAKEAAQADQAVLESRLLPAESVARALERYERHLQHQLLGAVRELEKIQARRRILAALRGAWEGRR